MAFFIRPKIGLALSGGGPKGFAHIGIIKVLEKHNIPIDYIAGTSAGALIGACYALKKNIKEVENLALSNTWKRMFSLFFDPSIKMGLIKGEKIIRFIQEYIGDVDFKKLQIPFVAMATDLITGKAVIIDSGSLVQAVRASISVPVFFKPVPYENMLLVDGGISYPVPVEAVKKMGADIVVACDLYQNSYDYLSPKERGFRHISQRTLEIMLYYLALENTKKADAVITPDVNDIGWRTIFTEVGSHQAILAGEKATELLIPKIKLIIKKRSLGEIFNSLIKRLGLKL